MTTRKTTLFYFSGTGNSLKVARDLAGELGDTELIAIPKAIQQGAVQSGDRTGVVFPTYFGGLPLIVAEFLSKLEAGGYAFAITTCGGMPGGALRQAAAMLRSRGGRLAAGFVVDMPGNYARLYGAMSARRQQKLFEEEKRRVKEIASIVRQERAHRIEAGFWLLNWPLALLYRCYFAPGARGRDRDFRVDEKCNSCGTCERVCPVSNIEMREGRPGWKHACEQCYACLQWCPKEAIQVGKKTVRRKRYRNPDIDVKDLVIPRG